MDDGAALELEHARRASSALDYDRRALVQDAFFGLARARRTAHATALSLGGDAVTYGALADWAAAVAERLGRGVAVAGVRCARGFAAYAAVYGALASGAAYVPLAATSPEPRQRAMLEGARAGALVVDGGAAPGGFRGALVVVGRRPHTTPTTSPRPRRAPDDPVYVMYTSGSSGAPKGVVVPHGCLVARVAWLSDAFGHPRALCCKTSYAFGVSEWELHWPLAVGGTGVLAPAGAEKDPSALARCLRASACSHVFVVSSVLRLLVDDLAAAPLPALSYVLQCGEALDGPLVERFYARVAGADLANVYGPTEASMTAWVAPRTFRSAADVVLVGAPVKNAFVVVLRAGSLDVAPPGEAGELCFGGILATGYVDGDAAAFPDAPAGPLGRFVDAAPKVLGERRLYRTGDAAVRGADGSLRVAGRLDRQVKASGRRVDLGELERALRDAGAREAHVSFVGDGHLVAAVAGDASVDWAADVEARTDVRLRLARTVAALPRLESGKPDAQRLAREAASALDAAKAPAFAPSGLSMSQFLASAYAADLAKAGVDSLGLVKAFKAGERADADFLAAERRVVDNARAWGMFGVVVDHWTMNGAAPKVAQAMFSLPFFVDGVAPTTQRHPPLNTACSLALRSVGNGQSLFLFVLVDAYDDACAASHAQPLGARDLASLAVYLAMRWPLPELLCGLAGLALWTEPVFGARCPGVFDGPYKVALRGIGVDMDWDVVAVHRWYVLFQLVARVASRAVDRRLVAGARRGGADRRTAAFAGAAACFGALALLAPYTMMRDCNLEVAFAAGGPRGAGPAAAVLRFAGRYFFWGGVVVWQGMFSMLFIYFAAYAAAPHVRGALLRRARSKGPPPCPAEAGAARKLRALACFAAYFAGCAAWTRAHPVHDAMFFGSFKLEWGLGNPPVDSPMPVHLRTAKRPVHHKAAVPGAVVLRRFALEIGVNAGLAALMFCAAAASRTRCRLLGSTTLGAYVVHPYVLGDAVAFLRALKAASTLPGRLADAAQMALMLGLPAVFVVAVGPLSNALLLAPLRAGARLVCESALREAPGADDDAPPPPPSGSPRRDALHLL